MYHFSLTAPTQNAVQLYKKKDPIKVNLEASTHVASIYIIIYVILWVNILSTSIFITER